MALRVRWSTRAKADFGDIQAYLNEYWTAKEVEKFVNKTNSILTIVSYQPLAFKASRYKHIRKAVITKHNSVFYLVRDSEVYLLSFWDNRMDPKKNKY
jgi:plasmid stabilization system protein ParE